MLQQQVDRLVTQVCKRLGRYDRWSEWLDRVAGWVIPGGGVMGLLPGGPAILPPIPLPILMPGRASNSGVVHDLNQGPAAPTTPHAGEPGDPPHSVAQCSNPRYRGMHGRPCRYSGGSDLLCPYGTEAGYWWRWYVPGVGNVYYVDCCGMPSLSRVWCNWAKEPNWCLQKGRGIYTCTLSLLHNEIHIGADGAADSRFHVPSGPPAGNSAPYTP